MKNRCFFGISRDCARGIGPNLLWAWPPTRRGLRNRRGAGCVGLRCPNGAFWGEFKAWDRLAGPAKTMKNRCF